MIGKNITELRNKRGYTLSELAELANVSKSYLSNIERSINKNPSLDVMKRIAAVLQVDLLTLLQNIEGLNGEYLIEKEWIYFINELKDSGIKSSDIKEYKTLIEFIRWRNEK